MIASGGALAGLVTEPRTEQLQRRGGRRHGAGNPQHAGESTLLYLISGTSGMVMVNGNNVAGVDDRAASLLRRRELGFVFQFCTLIPHLNVEENLLLPALLDGKKPADYRNALREVMGATDFDAAASPYAA